MNEVNVSQDSQDKDRKQEIVSAAFRALSKAGLPTLSYDVIAEEAGVSRQLVRYHFRESDDLMIALCDYLAGTYRDTLIAGVMKVEGSARVKLFLDFYFDLLSDMPKPRDDQVYDAVLSLAAGSEKVKTNLRAQYSLLGQVLSHEFALEYPNLGRQAAEELSYLFVCLMYGHWKMVASLGLAEYHKHITRAAMDRLLQSYTGNPKSLDLPGPIWHA